ncbi:type II toxin-antitoxin system PemK/MazF family toxin [Alkalicoccobacillus plakortidis]|uniref:Type II toxin-antitoxin system PemK/MazF family toxin n=1 Tax=Alkalicoccobacillus plakortidis TaxID=444060 RepID=A0ABT0XKY5_9BACI|nr:type II toxin-antitoxin system PemK/MazF family toxin [Alkalicoccobacillus plakortidis]MCM2675867.1 type II toxin-antitoxin system PemK/MazF family toxin [Alkalicoccobacillus plakortidis]
MVLKRGDIIKISFDPQSGHEQAGFRPALVISPEAFNTVTPFALVCPITNTIRGNAFEVELPNHLDTSGVVLVHHIKSLDIRSRRNNIKVVEEVSHETMEEVLDILSTLVT